MGEKEIRSGLCTMKTHRMGGIAWCVRPSLPPEAMVMSGPMLPLKAMSGSMDLLQQGSGCVSMARVAFKDHVDLFHLGWRLRQCVWESWPDGWCGRETVVPTLASHSTWERWSHPSSGWCGGSGPGGMGGGGLEGRATQDTTQAQSQGFELAHPGNDVLKCMKGLDLQNQSCRISKRNLG